MSLSAAERKVLLAAAAGPLRRPSREALWWCRTDTPVAQPLSADEGSAMRRLIGRGLLTSTGPVAGHWRELCRITPAGLEEAETLRSVLGRDRRRLLRQIGEADELVRRERETTEQEYCAILADGGEPTDRLVEWLQPDRSGFGPVEVCYDSELQQLAERGLVVLLNGGTRAQLTGAGRWCSEEKKSAKPAERF